MPIPPYDFGRTDAILASAAAADAQGQQTIRAIDAYLRNYDAKRGRKYTPPPAPPLQVRKMGLVPGGIQSMGVPDQIGPRQYLFGEGTPPQVRHGILGF